MTYLAPLILQLGNRNSTARTGLNKVNKDWNMFYRLEFN